MKTKLLLTFLLLLCLSACSRQIVRPVSPVDWSEVRGHVTQLAQPTVVEGDIQYRDQAVLGGDLWQLSGRQSLALERANGVVTSLTDYVLKLADRAEGAVAPPCGVLDFPCKRLKRALETQSVDSR